MQARADFNADRAALIRSGTTLKQAKIIVNQILSNSSFENFDVEPAIEMGEMLDLEVLTERALVENKSLSVARLNEMAASEKINELRGDWFPQVDVSGDMDTVKPRRVQASWISLIRPVLIMVLPQELICSTVLIKTEDPKTLKYD